MYGDGTLTFANLQRDSIRHGAQNRGRRQRHDNGIPLRRLHSPNGAFFGFYPNPESIRFDIPAYLEDEAQISLFAVGRRA